MIKYLALVLNGIVFSFLGYFLDSNISLDSKLPETYVAGEEFDVELTINKKDITGYARVEINLAEGLIPTNGDSKGGAFSYKEAENKIKIIWFNLPTEEEFTITYKVAVSPDYTGDINFSGKFSYVVQPAGKQEVEFETKTIQSSNGSNAIAANNTTAEEPEEEDTVTPEEIIASDNGSEVEEVEEELATVTEQVENTSSNTAPSETTTATTDNITITRSLNQSTINAGGELVVTVKINKGSLSEYSRFLDIIPNGFTAVEKESYGGKFSFQNNNVKILWLTMPSEPEFSISYKLVAEESTSGSFDLKEGLFFYASKEAGVPIKLAVESKSFSVKGAAVAVNEPDPIVENVPAPQTGVSYKVQICATHQNVTADYFVKNNNVTEPIAMEMHEGWTKFTVGSFGLYKDARDHREVVKTSYSIVGPFVTAYNSGDRITVQEALRLTNQTWYQ